MEMMIETDAVDHQSRRARSICLAARCSGARPVYGGALRHVRLHRELQHHRRAPTHDASACDFAKHMMQVSFAGTGIWLSDGATNIMPVAPHRAAEGGPPLTAGSNRREPRGRSSRLEAALRSHSALARGRFLSGLGSASGAVAPHAMLPCTRSFWRVSMRRQSVCVTLLRRRRKPRSSATSSTIAATGPGSAQLFSARC